MHAPTPLVGVKNPNDADVPTNPMEEVMLLALYILWIPKMFGFPLYFKGICAETPIN